MLFQRVERFAAENIYIYKLEMGRSTFQCANLVRIVGFSLLLGLISCAAPTVPQQCNDEFTKMGVCINYASGKAGSPSEECCSTVKTIKEDKPVCLCYVIQMTHQGEASLKRMGLQEAKLLQLPTACKLTNASISYCPKLLNLPPNSPDAAIFTNSSSPVTTSPSTSTPSKDEKSGGAMHGPEWAKPIGLTFIFTVLMCVFYS